MTRIAHRVPEATGAAKSEDVGEVRRDVDGEDDNEDPRE